MPRTSQAKFYLVQIQVALGRFEFVFPKRILKLTAQHTPMAHKKNQIYHIYNQGNNRRQIFFTPDNYKYFLFKLRGALTPFGDIIAYCLMSNHFHLLFYVKNPEVSKQVYFNSKEKAETARRKYKFGSKALPVQKRILSASKAKESIMLNVALGEIQRSYTRAINNEHNWSGSLFRSSVKSKGGMVDAFDEDKILGASFEIYVSDEYAKTCLSYIHKNPVKAKLSKTPEDYEWSSAKDYAGIRNGTLCNLEMGRQLIKI